MANKGLCLAGGAAAIYGVTLFNAAKRLSIRPLFPEQIKVETGAFKWIQPLAVINGAATTIPLSSFSFDLDLNGVFVGKVVSWSSNPIAPGETIVRGTVIVPILDLLAALPSLKNEGRTVRFGLNGGTSLFRLFRVPLPYIQQSITIPKLPF